MSDWGSKAMTALAVLAAAPVWAATNLGTPPGHRDAFVQAALVNASGTAVAIGSEGVGTNKSRTQAFVWQKGKKTLLTYHGAREVLATAIDAAGDVLGTAGSTAVLWRKGVPTALGAFSPSGMSDDGAIVIGTRKVSGNRLAVAWRKGILSVLPGLGGPAQAEAASRGGTIVGVSALPSGVEHAVVWRAGIASDLGSVNGLDSVATLVTADGTIFGFASTQIGNSRLALEWKKGRLIVLGRFGSGGAQPDAVNAQGDVLIETQTANQNAVGLLLLRNGKTIRIVVPALGQQPLRPVGLDDQGNVVGFGTETLRGFLWRNGHATLLPPDLQPQAVAGGWIVASKSSGGGVLLHLRS